MVIVDKTQQVLIEIWLPFDSNYMDFMGELLVMSQRGQSKPASYNQSGGFVVRILEYFQLDNEYSCSLSNLSFLPRLLTHSLSHFST